MLPGVGRRLDGWPNRDLNVGAIVALSPVLDQATKPVFQSWGPGRYDAYWNHDGKNAPVLIPPVSHYNATLALGLTAQQQADLVAFLKSL